MMNRRAQKEEMRRLKAARATVAQLVVFDPVYAPIFERLEREIEMLEQIESTDVVARARAVVAARQTATD